MIFIFQNLERQSFRNSEFRSALVPVSISLPMDDDETQQFDSSQEDSFNNNDGKK